MTATRMHQAHLNYRDTNDDMIEGVLGVYVIDGERATPKVREALKHSFSRILEWRFFQLIVCVFGNDTLAALVKESCLPLKF